MALSMDGINSYYQTMKSNADRSERANHMTDALKGISSESSEEELVKAVESFEAYMAEQIIKQMRDTISPEKEEESPTSQYVDMYIDSTIQQLAGDMVSQYGGNMTEDLVAQMKRNYGIE